MRRNSLSDKYFYGAGVEQVYVHVYRDNRAAQELYRKMGFEVTLSLFIKLFSFTYRTIKTDAASTLTFQMVETANAQLLEEQTFLLCFKT